MQYNCLLLTTSSLKTTCWEIITFYLFLPQRLYFSIRVNKCVSKYMFWLKPTYIDPTQPSVCTPPPWHQILCLICVLPQLNQKQKTICCWQIDNTPDQHYKSVPASQVDNSNRSNTMFICPAYRAAPGFVQHAQNMCPLLCSKHHAEYIHVYHPK